MNAPLLRLEDIEKAFFGVRVLKGVSLDVPHGGTVGLVGENGAGKSTLMNLLGGNLKPDAGRMFFAGEPYLPSSPRDAEQRGVAFIHQELNLFPNLTIAENLFLTSFPKSAGFINRRAMRRQTAELLGEVGLDASPDTPVGRLSAGRRQLVEIAKALSTRPQLMILDEPTTSLSTQETERLFALLQRLQQQGMAMIYISHALGDVMRLCDRIVVLRDGEVVGSGSRVEFTLERMISLMVGRQIEQLYPPRDDPPPDHEASAELLNVSGVTREPVVRNVSLSVRGGEIVGLSGLMGSGRTELARLLFGLDPIDDGRILLDGQPIERLSTSERIERGMAMITESRRDDGLCMDASIEDNAGLVAARRHSRTPAGWIDRSGLRQAIREIRDAVRLTPAADAAQPVKTLSGGNQQKVVLAKWLLNRPKLLILDEPTRGIDVGAKYEIYVLIRRLARQGAGILVISSEIEELIGICDRILVMSRGEIRDEIACDAFDRERILRAAFRQGQVPEVKA